MREDDSIFEADPREAKLPRWAQDRLQRLRNRALRETAYADAALLDTDPEGSSAVMHPYEKIPVGLGKHAEVRFKLGPHATRDYIDVRVGRGYDEGKLLLHAGDGLLIEPQSSNYLKVLVGRV